MKPIKTIGPSSCIHPQPAVDQVRPQSPPDSQRSRAPLERRAPRVPRGGAEAGCLAEASPADAGHHQNTNYRKKLNTLTGAPPSRKVNGVHAVSQMDARAHAPSQSQTAAEAGSPASAEFSPHVSWVKNSPSCSRWRRADRTACCPAHGQRRDLLAQLANSRRTRCPSAPACPAQLPSPAHPARRSRRSGPPNGNLRTPGKLRADLPARFPPATESRFPGRTGGRTCAQLRLPRAPRRRTHSPGGSLPSPRRPAPATWALASERARAQQPGARGLLGTQGARWGARGGPAAPARHPLRPAPARITALSAGRGLRGPRAGPQRPGPAGSAGSPGRLRRWVRSERASGRASGERARGRVGGRRRGGEGALGRARWAGGGEERGVGGRRWQTALCVAGPGAAETLAPPGAQVRALGTAAAPPPRAHPRARTPASPSSTALLTAPRRPSPSQENPGERWK